MRIDIGKDYIVLTEMIDRSKKTAHIFKASARAT